MAQELSAAAITLAKYVLDAVKEHGSAVVLREHIALIDRATKPVLEENAQLRERVRELEAANDLLVNELREKTRGSQAKEMTKRACEVLCMIHDRDGAVLDEDIMEALKMGAPEARMHIANLYEKCLISYPGEYLDDPRGYRITADGTAYVLNMRGQL